MRLLITCLVILYGTSFCQFGFAQQRWQDEKYLQQSFLQIALEREYKEEKSPKLSRWEIPIQAHIISDAGDKQLQSDLIHTQLQHLQSITGHPISFTTSKESANFFIIFTLMNQLENTVRTFIGDPDSIRAALNEAICLGHFTANKQYQIQRGIIIIPVDYARQKRRYLDCIIEETTQLMGLPNDSDLVFPSIFNDRSTDTYLSPLDYLLLRMLYSNKLKAGMDRTTVSKVLPDIVRQLKRNGELEHAPALAYKGSVKEYVGD